jgi:hypothetical protein
MDILKDIDENAFSGGFNATRETIMPGDEDLVNDDVPFNLSFVESYYGDQSKIKTSPESSRSEHSLAEKHGDELLAEGSSTLKNAYDRQRHRTLCRASETCNSSRKGEIW